MNYGAANKSFDSAFRVGINADFDSVPRDESHVVVGDFLGGAIREADLKWPERRGGKQLPDLFRLKHHVRLDGLVGFFNLDVAANSSSMCTAPFSSSWGRSCGRGGLCPQRTLIRSGSKRLGKGNKRPFVIGRFDCHSGHIWVTSQHLTIHWRLVRTPA